MRKRIPSSGRRHGEQGYALMLAVFLTTLMLIATLAAAPSVRTERQREKEEEMIWRGKQYVRAIKLYYRKNGRFPTTIDDLIKPKMGAVRYLRQQYKDPMNKEDGTWRLIYVGPMGQLIGSLKPPQTIQFLGAGGAVQPGAQAPGASGTPTSAFGSFGSTQSFTGNAPQPGTAGSAAQPGAPGTTPQAPGTGDSSTSQGLGAPAPVDTSNFIGGNIIGIGSKVDKKSVAIYEKASNYHLFEFVWDPSKDALVLGGSTTQVGTPVAPGQNPGQGFGFGQGQGTFGSQPGPATQPAGNPGPMQPSLPPLAPTGPQQ
jgi:hypothetical protein